MQNLEGFLGKIYPSIQALVKKAQNETSLEVIKQKAGQRHLPLVDVKDLIVKRISPIGVIAEIKRASPSLGDISNRNVVSQVQTYVDGGAVAISVLTEPGYFKGSLEDLTQLKEGFPYTPFLRKDFIVSEHQVYQSKAAGADMLLLITRWLEDEELKRLYQLTRSLGMHALVETETEEDIRRARAVGAEIIGINARNLVDLTVDVHRVTRLARGIVDKDFILIGESGVDNPAIVREWHAVGIDVVLVGGALMKSDDPKDMVRRFSLVE